MSESPRKAGVNEFNQKILEKFSSIESKNSSSNMNFHFKDLNALKFSLDDIKISNVYKEVIHFTFNVYHLFILWLFLSIESRIFLFVLLLKKKNQD